MTQEGIKRGNEAARAIEKLYGFIDLVKHKKAAEALARAGEALVNYCKINGPWKDQTGALRSSISYVIPTPTSLILFAGMDYAVHVEFKHGYWVLSGAVEALKKDITRILAEELRLKPGDIKWERGTGE